MKVNIRTGHVPENLVILIPLSRVGDYPVMRDLELVEVIELAEPCGGQDNSLLEPFLQIRNLDFVFINDALGVGQIRHRLEIHDSEPFNDPLGVLDNNVDKGEVGLGLELLLHLYHGFNGLLAVFIAFQSFGYIGKHVLIRAEHGFVV